MGGSWGKKLHPSKANRHEEAEAAGKAAALAKAAEDAEKFIAKQKADNLQQIDANVAAAKQTATAWHANELKKASTAYADKVDEYLGTVEQLQQEYKSSIDPIVASYTSEVAKGKAEEIQALATMQAEHAVLLKSCGSNLSIEALHAGLNSDLNSNHAELHSAYLKAINPITEKTEKISLYSKLDAWLADLYDDNKISMSQQQTYLRFLLAASFTEIDLSVGNAMWMHKQLLALLLTNKQDQVNELQSGYNNSSSITLVELKKHCQQRTEQLAQDYAKEFDRLAAVKTTQEQILTEHLNQALQTLEEEKQKLTEDYAEYCKELDQHYSRQNQEIEQQKVELCAAAEAQQKYQLDIIATRLAADLAAINNNLEEALKAIKRQSRGMLINFATTVASIAGAYFMGPLLAGFGATATVITSVERTLLLTGAGSLKNLLNGKDDKVGITLNMTFVPNTNFGPKATMPSAPATNSQSQNQFDLAAFKEKYAEKTKKILAAQAKTEHKLRYNLTKPVVSPLGQNQSGFGGLQQPQQPKFKSPPAQTKQSSAVVKKTSGSNGFRFTGKYFTYNANGIQAIGQQQLNGDYKFLLRNTARKNTSYSFMVPGVEMAKLQDSYFRRTTNTTVQNFIPEYDGMLENKHDLKWVKFGAGLVEGALVADGIMLVSRFIPGAPVVLAGLMAFQAGQMARSFNDHNFVATDDYDNISRLESMGMLRSGTTDNIWQAQNARQLAARSEARLSMGQRFQENPEGFGFFVGTFFTFKGAVAAYASNKLPGNLRPWESFKSTRQTGARDLAVAEHYKVEALAEKVYESIRKSQIDIKSIAKNTGIPTHRIQRIKDHIFNNTHELAYGTEKFAADPLVAETWKRMESGCHTQKDIALLKHELFESKFEGIFNTDYRTAHNAANKAGYTSGIEGLTSEHLQELYRGFLHRFSKN